MTKLFIWLMLILKVAVELNATGYSLNFGKVGYVSWAWSSQVPNSIEFTITKKCSHHKPEDNTTLALEISNNQNTLVNEVICAHTSTGATSVKHYYRDNNSTLPIALISQQNETIGLDNIQVIKENKNITCKFTRHNNLTYPNYLKLNANDLLNVKLIFNKNNEKLMDEVNRLIEDSKSLIFTLFESNNLTNTTLTISQNTIGSFFANAGHNLNNIASTVVNAITNFASSVGGSISSTVTSAVDTIGKFFSGLFK